MAEPVGLSALGDDAIALARGFAPDFYLAALLAPRAARTELVALAAFFGDIERIILTVSEPPLAEIRLQWWRDALAAAQAGDKSGHPVADFLGECVRAGRLPLALFDDLIEARTFDLYADAVPDEAFVTDYYDKADGSAFRLAASALGCGHSPPSALIEAAGQLYGATRVLRSMAALRARGRMPFPGLAYKDDARVQAELSLRRDSIARSLTDARLLWRNSSRLERAACLPIALVADYVAILRRSDSASQRSLGVLPLTRVWRLWSAHMGAGI